MLGVTTGTLRTDLMAVILSTGPLSNSSNWDTAYGWGNHAVVGYITSASLTTETNNRIAGDSVIGVTTATLRTDLTAETNNRIAGDSAIGVATGTLRTDLTSETNNRVAGDSAVGLTTATLRSDMAAVTVSTGDIAANLATEVGNRATADGTLNTRLNNVAVDTSTIAGQTSGKVSKAGDVMTGPLTLSGSTLTVGGAMGLGAAQIKLADNVVISSEASIAAGKGVMISSNVYITGFSSATKYYGDGSSLTGVVASGNVAKTGDTMSGQLSLLNNSTLTVTGNAFSVGGSTFAINNGLVSFGSSITVAGSALFQSTVAISEGLFQYGSGAAGLVLKSGGNGFLYWGTDNTAGAFATPYRIQMVNSAANSYADSVLAQNPGGTNITMIAGSSMTIIGDGANALGVSGLTTLTTMTVTGPAVFSKSITASSGVFNATGASQYSIVSSSGVTAPSYNLGMNITLSSITTAAYGGGLTVSTNVYIVGFSSAAKYYGDGSGLTNVPGEGLGNHIATMTLNMANFGLINVASITAGGYIRMSSATIMSSAAIGGSLDVAGAANLGTMTVTGAAVFGKGITASSGVFNATGINQYSIASSSGVTAPIYNLGANVTLSSAASPSNGGGLNISTNVYIVGFSSANKYYGDGSSLTGIAGDNLGNHSATQNLIMNGHNISNAGYITVSSVSLNNQLIVAGSATIAGNSFSVGAASLVVNSGQVGIGTASPSALLHVSAPAGSVGDLLLISTGSSNVIRMTGAGEVYAGKYFGDGSQLSNVISTPSVSKAGDTMTGQLTLAANSTMTITGGDFSVGGSTLAVSSGTVGIGIVPSTATMLTIRNDGLGATGIRIITTGLKPECNSSFRGSIFVEEGIPDLVFMCLQKGTPGNYQWVLITRGE